MLSQIGIPDKPLAILYFCFVVFSFTSHIITCAPVNTQHDDDVMLKNILTKSAQSDHLAYADFHADLRIVNLAADLITRVPRKFYLKDCTEKQYLEWYLNEYPTDCQFRFSNATSLKDLIKVYCDSWCGSTYLSYIEKCGQTAIEMADYYRNLCFNKKGNTKFREAH